MASKESQLKTGTYVPMLLSFAFIIALIIVIKATRHSLQELNLALAKNPQGNWVFGYDYLLGLIRQLQPNCFTFSVGSKVFTISRHIIIITNANISDYN